MLTDRLYYLTQDLDDMDHLRQISIAAAAGVRWIQLRSKQLPEKRVADIAREAAGLLKDTGCRLIINDHVEAAAAAGARGVHLGLNDMSVSKARSILGPDAVIGGTANTLDDVRRRIDEGADYIGLGPFRHTATKEQLSPVLGLDGLKRIISGLDQAEINLPIFAIGGIQAGDVREILDTGVYGIAVASAVNRSGSLRDALQLLNREILQWESGSVTSASARQRPGHNEHYQKKKVHEHWQSCNRE